MKFIFSFVAILFTSLPAFAQTAGGPVPDTVLSNEVEGLIVDYMKNKMGLPNASSKSSEQAKRADGEEDEEAEDEPKGKKNKKDKKNKGKAKGKDKKKKMPPGLAKRDELPPGLAKRKTLPPGLQVRELPEELVEQLPPPEPGQELIMADDNVVLIEEATGRVLDIIFGNKKQ